MATSLLLLSCALIQHRTSQHNKVNDLTVTLTTSSVTIAEIVDFSPTLAASASLIIPNTVR